MAWLKDESTAKTTYLPNTNSALRNLFFVVHTLLAQLSINLRAGSLVKYVKFPGKESLIHSLQQPYCCLQFSPIPHPSYRPGFGQKDQSRRIDHQHTANCLEGRTLPTHGTQQGLSLKEEEKLVLGDYRVEYCGLGVDLRFGPEQSKHGCDCWDTSQQCNWKFA